MLLWKMTVRGVVEGAEAGGVEGLGFDDQAIGFEELLDAGVDGGRGDGC